MLCKCGIIATQRLPAVVLQWVHMVILSSLVRRLVQGFDQHGIMQYERTCSMLSFILLNLFFPKTSPEHMLWPAPFGQSIQRSKSSTDCLNDLFTRQSSEGGPLCKTLSNGSNRNNGSAG